MTNTELNRAELIARLAAPGTAAGVVLQYMAKHPRLRHRLDVGAIAGASGVTPAKVAWGLSVVKTLGLLPVGATVAPTTIMTASDHKGFTKDCAAPAPAPAAPNPKNSQRLDEPRRQAPGSAVKAAADWLLETLTDRPLRASEIRRRAAEAGIAWRTLQRARTTASVEARRLGDGVGIWVRRDQGHGTAYHRGAVTARLQRR